MPSPHARRVRTLGLTVVLVVLVTLYITSAARQTRASEFYLKTTQALQVKKDAADAAARDLAADAGVTKRLKEAEEKAKQAAHHKAAPFKEELLQAQKEAKAETSRLEAEKAQQEAALRQAGDADQDGVKSVAGRKYMKENGVASSRPGMPQAVEKEEDKPKQTPTQEDRLLEEELNTILKRSPIIIFSKTYCPYSKKAKTILLEKYSITPPPHVVEIDEHPMGPQLQAKLAEMTGRSTVPNILINGRSIGGGDDVETLDVDGQLVDKVKSMGGRRIMEAKLVSESDKGAEKKGLR